MSNYEDWSDNDSLTYDEVIDTLLEILEDGEADFKWEYAFESITEPCSGFRKYLPIY